MIFVAYHIIQISCILNEKRTQDKRITIKVNVIVTTWTTNESESDTENVNRFGMQIQVLEQRQME